jgi:hypothetical protein
MKAWEYTLALLAEAEPAVLSDEEQTWTAIMEGEKSADALLCIQWSSHVPGSGAPESLIAGAVQSVESLGRNVDEAEGILAEGFEALKRKDLQALNALTARLYRALEESPVDPSSPYHRYRYYGSFEDYEKAVSFPDPVRLDLGSEDFADRTLAGWTAQIVGGALGTALEGYSTARLLRKFGDIRGYVRKPNTYNDDILRDSLPAGHGAEGPGNHRGGYRGGVGDPGPERMVRRAGGPGESAPGDIPA